MHGAAIAAVVDRDGEAERIRHRGFPMHGVGELWRTTRAWYAHQLFHLADIEPRAEFPASFRVRLSDQRPGMAGGKLARPDAAFTASALSRRSMLATWLRLCDGLSNIVLRSLEFVDQRLIARRLFDRVEVLALDILDDRKFKASPSVTSHDDRTSCRPALGRLPPPLVGDDLIGPGRVNTGRTAIGWMMPRSHRCRQLVEENNRKLRRGLRGLKRSSSIGAALAARALGGRVGFGAHVADQAMQAATSRDRRLSAISVLPRVFTFAYSYSLFGGFASHPPTDAAITAADRAPQGHHPRFWMISVARRR
jgi:hypothetical protein